MNFRKKTWSANGLDKIIKNIDDTGGTDHTNGSGRPKYLNQKIGQPNSPDLNPGLWITAFWKIYHKECINIKGLGICNT